jgi:hypothetical protein
VLCSGSCRRDERSTAPSVSRAVERSLPSGEPDVARIAVLADALKVAGCIDAIQSHLRATDLHVRGLSGHGRADWAILNHHADGCRAHVKGSGVRGFPRGVPPPIPSSAAPLRRS